MFRLDKQYREKEILIQRLILFALGIAMIILYFQQIITFVNRVLGICTPFIVGGFLGFVLNVVSGSLFSYGKKLIRLKDNKFTRFICNCLAVLLMFLLFVIFIFVLFPKIADSLQTVIADLPGSLYSFYIWILHSTEEMPDIHRWIQELDFSVENISASLEGLLTWFNTDMEAMIMSSVYNVLSSAFSWAFNCVMAVMFAIILLFNKTRVIHEGRSLLQAYLPPRLYSGTMHILKLIDSTFTGYIGGSCLECLILGTLVAVFTTIFGLPYGLLSGLVVGIGALVPMFGALFSAIFVALFMALESPMNGLYFMIIFICIQQVEGNFIYPHVLGKTVGLPPFYVMVAITLGANIAGVLGMIVFIPIISCIYQIIRENVTVRLKSHRNRENSYV